MSNYYYLDISLILQDQQEITPAFFKKNIVQAVKNLFGEIGAATNIDILKLDLANLRAIVRVPKSFYIKLRGSLTLCGSYEGQKCTYLVHKATPLLLALQVLQISCKMSHCRKLGLNGKDLVIFATKEDHAVPSKIELPKADPQPGLILPNGDINWNCPCLGGMATGPCGVEFRNAFSCFHHSKADPKGSDCFDRFKIMQTCMQKFPTLYNREIGDEDDELNSMVQAEQSAEAQSSNTANQTEEAPSSTSN